MEPEQELVNRVGWWWRRTKEDGKWDVTYVYEDEVTYYNNSELFDRWIYIPYPNESKVDNLRLDTDEFQDKLVDLIDKTKKKIADVFRSVADKMDKE